MNRKFKSKKRFIFIPLLAIAFIFLVGFLVMFLWNHTLSPIFGITAITLWQAMGLFFLCKLLFGFGKGPKRGGAPWKRRCGNQDVPGLSEAEKEKFRQYFNQKRCFWDGSRSKADEDQFNHADHDE